MNISGPSLVIERRGGSSRLRSLWLSFHAELRDARAVWARERTLRRELASYVTLSEVHDLLGSTRTAEGAAAEHTRAAVARNL